MIIVLVYFINKQCMEANVICIHTWDIKRSRNEGISIIFEGKNVVSIISVSAGAKSMSM